MAKEIKRRLPNERIIYFGDTKHLPYGEKSKEAIIVPLLIGLTLVFTG